MRNFTMSVLKRFRTTAKMEFFNTALKLRHDLTMLLLRDLGLKPKIRELELIVKDMPAADAKTFIDIARKYGLQKIPAEWPEWIISKMRNDLWDLCHRLIFHITAGNNIYCAVFSDAEMRRKHQDEAVSICHALYQEMQFAMDILPIDANKYAPYCDLIDRELALLKGWRKSDNRRYKELQDALECKRVAPEVASSSNFANVNGNGNANANNASNVNGVRPLC